MMATNNSRILILRMVFFCLFPILVVNHSIGQIKDNINWSSIRLTTSISEDATFTIAPIIRFNKNLSSYQNTSIDFSVRHQLADEWHMQLLSRTWFNPDQPGRQFIWLDVGYNRKLNKYGIASHLRMHYAFDINDRIDPDYVRWKSTFSLPGLSIIDAFIAIEPWFRLNENLQLQRMRYESGMHFKLNKKVRLSLVYRKEETINLIPWKDFNMYLLTLNFKL